MASRQLIGRYFSVLLLTFSSDERNARAIHDEAAKHRGSHLRHTPWWLSHTHRSAPQSLIALAQEYIVHNISVGAVDVEPVWETGLNDFIPTPDRFVGE